MADYRLFCFDDEGKLVLADWVSAESDEGAITAARVIKDASKVEVWQSDHLIATVQDGRAIYGEPRPNNVMFQSASRKPFQIRTFTGLWNGDHPNGADAGWKILRSSVPLPGRPELSR